MAEPFSEQNIVDEFGDAMRMVRRLERLRARREYGRRHVKDWNRWRGRPNAPRRYQPVRRPDLSAELADLETLPAIMPGEFPGDPYVAPFAEWQNGLYFRPDGSQILGRGREAALEWAQIDWSQKRIAATKRFLGGTRIWVSTVFLGTDMGIGSIPRLWETMIFAGTRDYFPQIALDYQWRYSSREAARHGHRVIANQLASRQRRTRSTEEGERRWLTESGSAG